MITPQEADALIQGHLPRLPSEDCPIDQAHGRTLREAVRADRDFPPFDRVTLDGYALRSEAIARGISKFRVIGMQPAGTLPLTVFSDDEAIEIATGAVVPRGADAVVPYEEAVREGGTVSLAGNGRVRAGNGVHLKGSDARTGSELVPAGTILTGREIAVAAACGAARVRVAGVPRVAVVATGDELVDVDNRDPAPHQIRRSNDYALRASLIGAGFPRVERFHLRDLKYELETQLKRLMSEFDVVILTGGVSKGKYDFLPAVLDALGVEKKFQGVAQRPGKPFWFGVTPRQVPVFALPGNPVSTFTCFHRYVLPALRAMAGQNAQPIKLITLTSQPQRSDDFTRFVPVQLSRDAQGLNSAAPMPSNTSGDFTGLIHTDGFVEIPAGNDPLEAAGVRFFPWQ